MTVMDGGAITYQYDLDIPEIAELWRRQSPWVSGPPTIRRYPGLSRRIRIVP